MLRRPFLFGSLAALVSCAGHVAPVTIGDVVPGGEPLKTAFNENAGKVRILMLVSPT